MEREVAKTQSFLLLTMLVKGGENMEGGSATNENTENFCALFAAKSLCVLLTLYHASCRHGTLYPSGSAFHIN